MEQTVESGIITDAVTNMFMMLSNSVDRLFDALSAVDLDISEEKETVDEEGQPNGRMFTVSSDQHQIHVKILNSAGRENLYDMYIVGDNNKHTKYPHIRPDQMDDKITEFLDENYGETFEEYEETNNDVDIEDGEFEDVDIEDASSSKKLQVSLSKIQSSSEIILGPVYCNYGEFEVYEDLENVLDSDEFTNSLTEEPQMFEIVPSEDEYEIVEIDEIAPMDYASAIIRAQIIAIMQLMSCKWNSDVDLDENPMSALNTIRWQLDWLITSKLCALNVNVLEILQSIQPEEMEPRGDVSDIVENYALVLDLYYSNFPHEIQKLLDEWLLTIRY